jgi:hypothetical protein
MPRIFALALAALALLGCAYDTCPGTPCGDACWRCSALSLADCDGLRPPDGACQGDGTCGPDPHPVCKSPIPQPVP